MREQEWLDRVNTAMSCYKDIDEANKESVKAFVNWLYAIYGIVPPENRSKKSDHE